VRRKLNPPTDDYPAPWEARPVSLERWQKHRDRMMAACAIGRRPIEWWKYEMRRPPPDNETQVLYAMGVLRADELHKLTKWWKMAYDEANEVISVGSFETMRKTPEQRQAYLDRHGVPREVVLRWDAERAEGAA